jgi:hypothetical protein
MVDRSGGSVAQPFTGSGVFKGYNNMSGLRGILDRHDDLDVALGEWGWSQVQLADGLLALGEQMEDAFIWNPLDLAESDAVAEARWRAALAFPEGFSLEACDAGRSRVERSRPPQTSH